MRRMWIVTMCAGAALLATQASAQVNCDQVKRYAQTGRTAEQIADTMIADVDAVKKCLEGAEKAPPMAGSAPAGGAGAAGGGGEKKTE
jgi:hypothetical protein